MSLPPSVVDATKTLYAGLVVVAIAPTAYKITGATAAGATDVISKAGHLFADGDLVQFVSGTTFTGLTAGAYYYVVNAVATTSFKVSLTSGGAAIDITADGTAGVFHKIHAFESEDLDAPEDREPDAELLHPDNTLTLRPIRQTPRRAQENFLLRAIEVKRLLEVFGGALTGRFTATSTLWVRDPDDASGLVALKSESFACIVTRDSGLKLGGREFSSTAFSIKSNKLGAIAWTKDVAA